MVFRYLAYIKILNYRNNDLLFHPGRIVFEKCLGSSYSMVKWLSINSDYLTSAVARNPSCTHTGKYKHVDRKNKDQAKEDKFNRVSVILASQKRFL